MESDAVIVAALEGDRTALEQALGTRGDPNAMGLRYTPLTAAVSEAHHPVVRSLLEAGARPDLASPFGLVPLGLAVQHGDVRMVRILLTHGADPEIRQYGVSVISMAQERGHEDVVEVLVAHGARRPDDSPDWPPSAEDPTVIMTSARMPAMPDPSRDEPET